MLSKHNPSPEQEAALDAERQACYQAWREDKLNACFKYVMASRNKFDRDQRLSNIRSKLGGSGKRFMNDLYDRLDNHHNKAL